MILFLFLTHIIMETIDILSEIVDYLSLKGVKNELNIIKARSLQENVNLILLNIYLIV